MQATISPEKISTIIFDVGHTLLFPDSRFLLELASDWIKISYEDFERIGAKAKSKAYRQAPRDPFKLWFGSWMLDVGVPESALENIFTAIISRHKKSHLWNTLEQDVPEILRDLRDADYTLGVISNADGSVSGLLEKFQLDQYFKCILDSAIEGIEKPDARIFLRAAERLNCKPADCLYVGDHPVYDVQGAQRAGMQSVLLDPWDLENYDQCLCIRRLSELNRLLKLK